MQLASAPRNSADVKICCARTGSNDTPPLAQLLAGGAGGAGRAPTVLESELEPPLEQPASASTPSSGNSRKRGWGECMRKTLDHVLAPLDAMVQPLAQQEQHGWSQLGLAGICGITIWSCPAKPCAEEWWPFSRIFGYGLPCRGFPGGRHLLAFVVLEDCRMPGVNSMSSVAFGRHGNGVTRRLALVDWASASVRSALVSYPSCVRQKANECPALTSRSATYWTLCAADRKGEQQRSGRGRHPTNPIDAKVGA